MVLDFLNGVYPILYIPIAIVALALGVDRALRSEEEESDILKIVGGVSGILLLVMTVLLAINEFDDGNVISNWTILFGIFLGMSLIARPFKELPLAFVIAVLATLGLLYILIASRDSGVNFFTIPLQYILIGVMVIVLIVFIISFIYEQAVDGMLFILGWGPIIVILGLIMFIQAITLLVDYPNQDGILYYLPG